MVNLFEVPDVNFLEILVQADGVMLDTNMMSVQQTMVAPEGVVVLHKLHGVVYLVAHFFDCISDVGSALRAATSATWSLN